MANALDQVFGLSGKAQALFFRQLATMVQAGFSFTAALASLQKQTSGGPIRRWLDDAVPKLTHGGKTLASAFEDYPHLWSTFVVSMVTAAEKSGRVDVTLITLADHLEREYTNRLEFATRLVYPFILLNGGILIPPVVQWYMDGFSAYMRLVAPPLIAMYGFFAVLFIINRAAILKPVKLVSDNIGLALPVFGKLVRLQATMWFVRSLAELYDAGLPVAKAVQLSAQSCGNMALQSRFLAAVPLIDQGRSLTEAFTQSHALPIGVLQILGSAEQSGSLGTALRKASDLIEIEVRAAAATLGTVLPVVIFLCVAVYMGYTMIGMLNKIYAPLKDINV